MLKKEKARSPGRDVGLCMPFFSRRSVPSDVSARAAATSVEQPQKALIKVALLGDGGVGKTSLMARYIEGAFDRTQLPTQGINFMERTVSLGDEEVVFSIWDVGGHGDSESMLPLVCNDATAVLLLFDLARPDTLDSVREWHRRARALNKYALPFLVGCKYDTLLAERTPEEHVHICRAARRFAHAIDAPLAFCAPSIPINVTNIFKVLLIRLLGLAPAVPQLRQTGEPLLIYDHQLLDDDDAELMQHDDSVPLPSRVSNAIPPPPPPLPGSSRGGTPTADHAAARHSSQRAPSIEREPSRASSDLGV